MDFRRCLLACLWTVAALVPLLGTPPAAQAQGTLPAGCSNQTYADVVALDQPWVWNRFGAMEPQGMMYALRRDVVPSADADGLPDPGVTYALTAGQVTLRRDKRPRPLVLRVNVGDCLHIKFTNLLVSPVPNSKDEQPATRGASIHVVGLEAVNSIRDMGSNVGNNPAGGIVAPGGVVEYWLYAPKEGTYVFYSAGAMLGGEGDSGSISSGLFGAVNVEPAGSVWYRSQVTRDDIELTRTDVHNPAVDSFPAINYSKTYPTGHRYANLPILQMKNGNELVHADLTAIISGAPDGGIPAERGDDQHLSQPHAAVPRVHHHLPRRGGSGAGVPAVRDRPVLPHPAQRARRLRDQLRHRRRGRGDPRQPGRRGPGPRLRGVQVRGVLPQLLGAGRPRHGGRRAGQRPVHQRRRSRPATRGCYTDSGSKATGRSIRTIRRTSTTAT